MNEPYSRAHPSPRYQELQALYQTMHREGETFLGIPPQKTFPGASLLPQAARIKRMIALTGARTVLDYGSGKGMQYLPRTIRDSGSGQEWPDIQHYWGVQEIVCYDPCYAAYSTLPPGRFDGVISTDVLEHCPEPDVPWIIEEIFAYARHFVFANVACYPARKRLPNGENAHCTIKPVAWWTDLITHVAARHPTLQWEVWVQFVVGTESAQKIAEQKISNIP